MGYFRGKPRGRYFVPRQGIDLSNVRPATPEIKFRSGATIGYNETAGEWQKGIKILATLSQGTYTSEWKGKYGRGVEIAVDTTSIRDGHPFGALYVTFERDSAYPHSGGSPDCAFRVVGTNYAACPSGGVRGIDIQAYCRAAMGSIHGALITARVHSSGSGTGSIYGARIVSKCQSASGGFASMHALEVADESDGVVCAENSILFIEKQSNSYQANSKAGIEIVNNSLTTYAKDFTYGIFLKSGASGAQFTYALGFDSNNGDEGFTAIGDGNLAGNVNGYFAVRDAQTGQTLYVNCYDTVPS